MKNESDSLENAVHIVAQLLGQLACDRYGDPKAKISVMPRDGHVRLDVSGPVICELDSVLQSADMVESREWPDHSPAGTIQLDQHRGSVTINIRSREEAIRLAKALAKEASIELVEGYLHDEHPSLDFKNDPEMAAHIAAALIQEIRQQAKRLGAGKILESLEKKENGRKRDFSRE